jgi:hypothetical protein
MAGPANVGVDTGAVGRKGAVSVSVSVGVAEGGSVGVPVGGSVNIGVAVGGKANVGVPVAGKIACVPGKPHENKNSPGNTNSKMNSFRDFILHRLNRSFEYHTNRCPGRCFHFYCNPFDFENEWPLFFFLNRRQGAVVFGRFRCILKLWRMQV